MTRELLEDPDPEEVEAAFAAIYQDERGVEHNDTPPKEPHPMDHERKGKKGKKSPVISYVRSLGEYKVASEVADELDVSVALIRKLARNRVTQAPSKVAPFGNSRVHLYTPEDVTALREYLEDQHKVFDYDEYYGEEH